MSESSLGHCLEQAPTQDLLQDPHTGGQDHEPEQLASDALACLFRTGHYGLLAFSKSLCFNTARSGRASRRNQAALLATRFAKDNLSQVR